MAAFEFSGPSSTALQSFVHRKRRDCAICLCPLPALGSPCARPEHCVHVFCAACIKVCVGKFKKVSPPVTVTNDLQQWLRVAACCPLCKTPCGALLHYDGAEAAAGGAAEAVRREIVEPPKQQQEEEEQEEQAVLCAVCGSAAAPEALLLCDACDVGAAHLFCLDPPLLAVPEGDWFCGQCQRRRARGLSARVGSMITGPPAPHHRGYKLDGFVVVDELEDESEDGAGAEPAGQHGRQEGDLEESESEEGSSAERISKRHRPRIARKHSAEPVGVDDTEPEAEPVLVASQSDGEENNVAAAAKAPRPKLTPSHRRRQPLYSPPPSTADHSWLDALAFTGRQARLDDEAKPRPPSSSSKKRPLVRDPEEAADDSDESPYLPRVLSRRPSRRLDSDPAASSPSTVPISSASSAAASSGRGSGCSGGSGDGKPTPTPVRASSSGKGTRPEPGTPLTTTSTVGSFLSAFQFEGSHAPVRKKPHLA